MTAKEMFERLGYKQIIKKNTNGTVYLIEYIRKKTGWKHTYSYYEFWLCNKSIKTATYYDDYDLHHEYQFKPKEIPFNQLQAINKQIEELGWNK